MNQDATWYGGRPRPGDIVLDEDPAPSLQKEHSPQFSANVYYGQTARWIKMPLGAEVDLGTGSTVLDGDPAPQKRSTAPNFRHMSIVAKRSPISATAELLFLSTFHAFWSPSGCRSHVFAEMDAAVLGEVVCGVRCT